ncbi:response regulator [Pseudochryseolinea flava]|uniref:Response regulator n=1 Tax=Pseudochryseolinea flava TaxID=2059302 RepID=A0A364Y3W5_9BACT|nr:response regulator [Pseudochryseolinea flava]RAW01547.1 response regulator [Pseudochryseolinea flava]
MRRVINILLIEDDSLDQIEVQRTLAKKNIVNRLKIVTNGEDALSGLRNRQAEFFYGNPDLILVDVNLPKMDGFEFLKNLRSEDRFKDLKIFVLTTSDEREDKVRANELGVSGFITKPLKLESPPSIDAFNLMIDLMNLQAN